MTTHSKLLSQAEASRIGKHIGVAEKNLKLSSLQAFDTEHQFSKMLRFVSVCVWDIDQGNIIMDKFYLCIWT